LGVEVELVDSEVSLAIVDEDTGDFVVVDNSVFHSDDVLLLEDDKSLVFWVRHSDFDPLCCVLLPSTANEESIHHSPHLGISTLKVVINLRLQTQLNHTLLIALKRAVAVVPNRTLVHHKAHICLLTA